MSFGKNHSLNLAKAAKTHYCGVEPNLKAHQKEIGFQIELI